MTPIRHRLRDAPGGGVGAALREMHSREMHRDGDLESLQCGILTNTLILFVVVRVSTRAARVLALSVEVNKSCKKIRETASVSSRLPFSAAKVFSTCLALARSHFTSSVITCMHLPGAHT